MQHASGDQGFLPDMLASVPPRFLENILGHAFLDGPTTMPYKFADQSANANLLSFMRELKGAEQSARKQSATPPEKVASMTDEQLSFLKDCRMRFQKTDGKDQKARQMYLSIRSESSETPLEDLKESASLLTIASQAQIDAFSSLDLADVGSQNTQSMSSFSCRHDH